MRLLNLVLAAVAAAVLAAFVVIYFVVSGGSNDASENGLAEEQQTPRVQPRQTEPSAANETADTTEQDNEPMPIQVVEEEAPEDVGEAVEQLVQPEAPQAEASDPFTSELQAGVDEFLEFGENITEKFPDLLIALQVSDSITQAAAKLMTLDIELRVQNLSRAERLTKMKAQLSESMRQFENYDIDWEELRQNPAMQEEMRDFGNYVLTNMPTKLFRMMGTQFDYSNYMRSN